MHSSNIETYTYSLIKGCKKVVFQVGSMGRSNHYQRKTIPDILAISTNYLRSL